MKKILSMIFAAVFSAAVAGTPALEASVPKLLTYQGVLKDANGSYLTGSYDMTFRVYGSSSGGSALWSESQTGVSVNSGRFSVELGSVSALNLDFSQDYWLSVQVGTDTEMTPRQRLTSAGYALMAESVVNGFSQAQHDALSHRDIEGVKANTSNIAKTNFKLDAYTLASANSMGDMIIDSFNDASGIDAAQSSGYVFRGSPNYDVTASSGSGLDAETVLLLHMNGANGSASFTDSSDKQHSVTASGNAQTGTAQSKFGGSSVSLDGAGDYLTLSSNPDWDFGMGDFTIDFWVRFNTAGAGQCFIDRNETSIFSIRIGGDGNLKFEIMGAAVVNYAWSPATNTWYHIAAVRSGTQAMLFINGNLTGSGANSSNISGNGDVVIGALALSKVHNLNGWIDELRGSKGVARWTANFTLPAEEYGATQPGASGTVVSIPFAEPSSPKEAMVIADEILNTGSIAYSVSRDNGVTWTSCPKESVVNLNSQPQGTQLRWKAVIAGDAQLKAIAMAL